MDEQYEHAITRVPIRKHARTCHHCVNQPLDLSAYQPFSWFAKLPVEIILEIFSYLSNEDLRAVRRVSVLFNKISSDPFLWRTYEVTFRKQTTGQVLMDLQRMSFLRKFNVTMRPDCDDILRQLSITNRNLQELYVTNCTGMTAKLFLRSSHLISILERCRNLHTINISGSRFRGLKFYRLLGEIGPRLRSACVSATKMQFFTFIMNIQQISWADREMICRLCTTTKTCALIYYRITKKADRVCTVMINYVDKHVMLVNTDRLGTTTKLTVARIFSYTHNGD